MWGYFQIKLVYELLDSIDVPPRSGGTSSILVGLEKMQRMNLFLLLLTHLIWVTHLIFPCLYPKFLSSAPLVLRFSGSDWIVPLTFSWVLIFYNCMSQFLTRNILYISRFVYLYSPTHPSTWHACIPPSIHPYFLISSLLVLFLWGTLICTMMAHPYNSMQCKHLGMM